MPKPKVVASGEGITKILPVLQNEKGEPILDQEGKPFIMGQGGKSNFTNFTTDNGLALDAISCSVMDKSGNLWFGTYGGGVCTYNGKSFSSFTTAQGLANNTVLSIAEDENGNLWFGTYEGGVSCYNGMSFTSYTTAQGLANNIVTSILVDKSVPIGEVGIWFGTQGGGVSRYNGKSFTNFTTAQGLANNTVLSILDVKKVPHGEIGIWFGTQGGGVSRFNGKSFTSFTTAQGLANNQVLSMLEDDAGNLWFGTKGGGVSRYDGKSFTSFTTANGLANNTVFSILEERSITTGEVGIWFGTQGGGVSRYNGKTFTSYTTDQGLANNSVLSILKDKAGNLWFGTQGGGVSRYDGKSFTSFTTAQGLANNQVLSILEDQALPTKEVAIWFGTNGGGISHYDGISFTTFTTAQGLSNKIVTSILRDKTGNIWFGTNGGGVSRYDGKSFTSFTTAQGLANNQVLSMLEDRAGNLWFGTNGGGISRFNGKSFTSYTTNQGLANNQVWSILEDKTVPIGEVRIWFGTYGGGVSLYDGKSFSSFTTAQGLANNTVFSILQDRTGNLWFGTAEGLSVMIAGERKEELGERNGKVNISYQKIRSFKIADGLPDNFVTQVIQLPDGKMAAGTNLGIMLFKPSNNFTELTNVEIYNSNAGYPIKDVNTGQDAMLIDSKGVIWVATGSEKTALVRFDYSALQKNTEPPVLLIQSIKIKDENICWGNLQSKGVRKNAEDTASALLQEFMAYGKTLSAMENDSILKRFGNISFKGITKFYPLPENLVLPYEHNQIAFEFVAVETDRPFLVKYQYMLDGYDKGWSPITNKSNATFGNINEGTYTFKLKAQGANGFWSEPIEYTFKVLPPWYRTWWAYLGYSFLFFLVLYMFSLWRERNFRAEKEKLEKTVEARTEELVHKNKVVEKQKEELVQKNVVIEKEKNEAGKQRDEANRLRKRSDDLLLNILPEEVAEELKEKGSSEAKLFEEVTVLFTDFVDFTGTAEKLSPHVLVAELNECFCAFDLIIEKHGLEKIKTIGDAYMAVGGLPNQNPAHGEKVVQAALDISHFMAERKKKGNTFDIRLGINSGSVVAGIVGLKKFQYDIWGDTVNVASRMESNGEIGKVNISGSTFELVKNQFNCVVRGKIEAKGKGEIDMYFVEGKN